MLAGSQPGVWHKCENANRLRSAERKRHTHTHTHPDTHRRTNNISQFERLGCGCWCMAKLFYQFRECFRKMMLWQWFAQWLFVPQSCTWPDGLTFESAWQTEGLAGWQKKCRGNAAGLSPPVRFSWETSPYQGLANRVSMRKRATLRSILGHPAWK